MRAIGRVMALKGFLLYVAKKKKRNSKWRKRKSDYWFSPPICCFLSHTRELLWNHKAASNFSFYFPLSLPFLSSKILTLSSISPLSLHFAISVTPLLNQISILICLHSPPLPSTTAPPTCVFFCLTAVLGARGSWKEVWQLLAKHH